MFLTEELTFDHVLPRAQGGRTSWDNVCASCGPCNRLKDNRTPEQAGMKLLKKPVKPRYLPVITVQMDRRQVPEEWRPYWTAALEP